MTTTPPPTLGADAAQSTTGTSSTSGASAAAGGFGLDKDAFLKILVEQLKHQDPSQPGDSQQYITQMTAFSTLEQITNLGQTAQAQQADAAAGTAVSLIGRTVSWRDADGNDQSGVVDHVTFDAKGPTLTVGGQDVDPANVTEVR